jgi:hypothetical protein
MAYGGLANLGLTRFYLLGGIKVRPLRNEKNQPMVRVGLVGEERPLRQRQGSPNNSGGRDMCAQKSGPLSKVPSPNKQTATVSR